MSDLRKMRNIMRDSFPLEVDGKKKKWGKMTIKPEDNIIDQWLKIQRYATKHVYPTLSVKEILAYCMECIAPDGGKCEMVKGEDAQKGFAEFGVTYSKYQDQLFTRVISHHNKQNEEELLRNVFFFLVPTGKNDKFEGVFVDINNQFKTSCDCATYSRRGSNLMYNGTEFGHFTFFNAKSLIGPQIVAKIVEDAFPDNDPKHDMAWYKENTIREESNLAYHTSIAVNSPLLKSLRHLTTIGIRTKDNNLITYADKVAGIFSRVASTRNKSMSTLIPFCMTLSYYIHYFSQLYEIEQMINMEEAYIREMNSKSHADAFTTKKNIPQNVLELMAKSNFLKCGYKAVEYDEEVSSDYVKSVEKGYLDVYKYLPKPKAPAPMLRFRKLGNYKALGLYNMRKNCIAIDIRDVSALVHEFGHYVDYSSLADGNKYSYSIIDMDFVEKVYAPYKLFVESNASKLGIPTAKISYYTTPTEVFARAFEVAMADKFQKTGEWKKGYSMFSNTPQELRSEGQYKAYFISEEQYKTVLDCMSKYI